jgi:uncharacterized protein YjdB
MGTFSNGTTQDITTLVTWASTNRTVAQVSNAAVSRGVIRALTVGTSSITAKYLGVTSTTGVTVSSVILQFIQVEPGFGSMAPGTSQQFTATGFYSDGSQAVLAGVTWSSNKAMVATVSTTGVVSAIANGAADINADFGGLTGSTSLTVASPVSILVEPTNPTVRVGHTLQFSATAIFIDGSTQVLTGLASWTSSKPMFAGVSNSGLTKGLVTGVSPGTASILAIHSGVGGSTTVTITP